MAAVEAYGAERMLAELQEALRAGNYRPAPVRRVHIPKPDGSKRPLGIPAANSRAWLPKLSSLSCAMMLSASDPP